MSAALRRVLGRPWWEDWIRSTLHLVELLGLPRERGAKLRLLAAWYVLGPAVRRGVLRRMRVRIRFPCQGRELSATVADRSELEVLREIFVGGEYELPGVSDPETIVDIGSNIGLSVLFFHERYPSARVVAIEPDPDAFARLRQNTKGRLGVELINAAVADHEGEITLYSGSASWAASLVPSADRTTQHSVTAVTLDGLADRISLGRISVLKLDIEGAEVSVLTSTSLLDRVDVLVFEYHREYCDMTLPDLLERLDSFRVRRFVGNSESHATVVLERLRGAPTAVG